MASSVRRLKLFSNRGTDEFPFVDDTNAILKRIMQIADITDAVVLVRINLLLMAKCDLGK